MVCGNAEHLSAWLDQRCRNSWIRRGHHRHHFRAVQHLRAKPVVAVPPGWQVGQLSSGRAFIHHAQLGGEDTSRMAGIQRRARAGYHREPVTLNGK